MFVNKDSTALQEKEKAIRERHKMPDMPRIQNLTLLGGAEYKHYLISIEFSFLLLSISAISLTIHYLILLPANLLPVD